MKDKIDKVQDNDQKDLLIQNIPFLAFKKNKKLTRYCRDQTIKKGKVFETHSKNKKGEFEPCNTIKPLLCCK